MLKWFEFPGAWICDHFAKSSWPSQRGLQTILKLLWKRLQWYDNHQHTCCSACSQPSESAVTSIFFFFLFFESTTELSLRPGVVLSPAGNATIIDITVALVPRSALSGTANVHDSIFRHIQ